jgi:hypothetical protein
MGDFEVTGCVADKPISGAWHNGPNPCWITVTHIPTQASVRVYSGDRPQHKAREAAQTMLEWLVEDFGSGPCNFPENVRLEEEPKT